MGACYESFRDIISDAGSETNAKSPSDSMSDVGCPADLPGEEWEDRMRARLKNAAFTAAAINEYGQRIMIYLEAKATHPLDMMYVHSHIGEQPQSVRERNDIPLHALMSDMYETVVTPQSLEDEVRDHLRHEDWNGFNELQWIRSMMKFVALRMFNYVDKSNSSAAQTDRNRTKKAEAAVISSTPAIRASTNYARFEGIEDSDEDVAN